jgi:hypothetical protein
LYPPPPPLPSTIIGKCCIILGIKRVQRGKVTKVGGHSGCVSRRGAGGAGANLGERATSVGIHSIPFCTWCTIGGEEAADGQGPLHLAAQWGQEEVVTALIEHGADMNRQDAEGRTPLHHAIQNGQQGIINMLLGCPGIHLSARYNNIDDLCNFFVMW